MTGSKKIPGMISDPWRAGSDDVKPRPRTVKQATEGTADPSEDWVDSTYTTVTLKGYGGITIETKAKEISPGAYLLKFCVDNLSAIDDILVEYGVLVDKTDQDVSGLPFYIQRNDGWCFWTCGQFQCDGRNL
jgi:hypothetical protein